MKTQLYRALLLTLLFAREAAAEVDARLSQQQVMAGQTVLLTLEQTGPDASAPDLTPLEQNFRITSRSQSEDIRIVSGERRARQTLKLMLLPRRTGTLTVPGIRIGNDMTQPLSLAVAETTSSDSRLLAPPPDVMSSVPQQATPLSVSVAARVEPKRALVKQQVLLVVRVSSPNATPIGLLHEPEISGARVLPLGEEKRTEADGLQIFERRYALFPTKPGTLNIAPLRFDAWRIDGGAPVTKQSEALSVQVEPIPDKATDLPWLPARALSLTEAGPTSVRIAPGQTVERMITLRAEGVMAEDLPPVPLRIPFQLRIRDDPPRLWNERNPDGVVGYRSERILIGAAEDGEFTLKAGAIDWWNTSTNRLEKTTLPDWTLVVAPFQSEHRRPPATWEPPPQPTPSAGDAGQEPAQGTPEQRAEGLLQRSWPWLAGLFALIALTSLARLLRRGTHERAPAAPVKPVAAPERSDEALAAPDPLEVAVSNIEDAYRRGNANAARDALLGWGALLWPDAKPANLAQLALRTPAPLRDDIRLLEKSFFSPTPIDWTRSNIAESLSAAASAGPVGES